MTGVQTCALPISVTELVTLIKTQRVFEMNSQVIQAANETLRNISNIRSF